MIICIYKLTSPSGKVYIGQTINFEKRLDSYKKLKCKNQPKIYNALVKYGFENFQNEIVITLNTYNKEELNNLEIFYIKEYDSCTSGYNCTIGGAGSVGYVHTIESKNKISKIHKGKKLSEKHKKKISTHFKNFKRTVSHNLKNSISKKGSKNPNFNKKLTVEQIENLRIARENKKKLRYIKDNFGNEIAFKSARALCKELNLNESNLSLLLNGKLKKYKGYTI
jgi:group I intron endonuclease